ncbi:MAG: hypothetical protein K6A38_08020 [Lachnospiraceae bacterium]|nr:hypothetical protein [Lachnospiraceae bacterium]
MLTLIALILFFAIFGKLIGFALRLGWGIFKIALYLVFCPAVILFMIFSGLIYVALPILIIVGIAGLFKRA